MNRNDFIEPFGAEGVIPLLETQALREWPIFFIAKNDIEPSGKSDRLQRILDAGESLAE